MFSSRASAHTLHKELVALTVGASGKLPNPDNARAVLQSYLEHAVPGIQINKINPTSTLAALNSVSANVDFNYNGKHYDAFAKVHIESNREIREVSSAAGVKEYQNAALLEKFGWPVISPLDIPLNQDFPILFYPRIRSSTLFDLLANSYNENRSLLSEIHLKNLRSFEQIVGKACLESLRIASRDEAIDENNAPAQSLFLSRVVHGGRIDQWYQAQTLFQLPGISEPLSWSQISQSRWKINGQEFDSTLLELIEKSRHILAHSEEKNAMICFSHGDDHAGNIFLEDSLAVGRVFDPAFAGWNPAALAHVKAFMHSGVLPLAGLYYNPKLSFCEYAVDESGIDVKLNFHDHHMLRTHFAIAKNIVDYRIIPLFKGMKELGADTRLEYERFKAGMLTCCILVINLAGLLSKSKNATASDSGSGEGLLPLAFLCSRMTGLPQLDYLDAEIKKVI